MEVRNDEASMATTCSTSKRTFVLEEIDQGKALPKLLR
jgi:hypothetical protein